MHANRIEVLKFCVRTGGEELYVGAALLDGRRRQPRHCAISIEKSRPLVGADRFEAVVCQDGAEIGWLVGANNRNQLVSEIAVVRVPHIAFDLAFDLPVESNANLGTQHVEVAARSSHHTATAAPLIEQAGRTLDRMPGRARAPRPRSVGT